MSDHVQGSQNHEHDSQRIIIKVSFHELPEETRFVKVKPTTKMRSLFKAYARAVGQDEWDICNRLIYSGRLLDGSDTPMSLSMSYDDINIVYRMPEQRGGSACDHRSPFLPLTTTVLC